MHSRYVVMGKADCIPTNGFALVILCCIPMNWQYSTHKCGFFCVTEALVVKRIVCEKTLNKTENNRFDFIKEISG